ncbi:MAG: ABC transporter substrate-binding protein [Promethearchaeota archaeon]
MHKGRALLLLALLTFNFLFLFMTVPIQAADKAPWKDQGLGWYYDNLNHEDRQKIRQAIDYCIPRETIIDDIYMEYAVAIPSPIGVNFEGVYEPTIKSREYSPEKAAELLKDVFGLIYDEAADGTNTTHTNVPYFKMTLIVPTTNSASASLISYSLNNVGIDTNLKWWNWNIIMPRLFLDPVGTGYNYEHGGYDMFFVGCNASPDPTYKEYYDKTCYPPSSNCYWIEDGAPTSGKWADKAYPNVTALWTDIYAEPDPIERVKLLKEYQQWCYDQVPTAIIWQEILVFGMDINVKGFDLLYGFKQNLGNITIPGQTSAVIAQPGDYIDLNPLESSSYYDLIILDNIFCELSRRRGEYNITHAIPWLAEKWTHSDDYLEWVVTIRDGVKWSDGTAVTADDVYFSYQAALDKDVGCPSRGTLLNIVGNASNIKKIGDMEITFTLPKFYPYVETVLFQLDILQKAQMSKVPFAEWKTDDTNTKYAPIGCGQYMFDSFPDSDTIVIKTNPEYDPAVMGHDPTMVGGGNWIPTPSLSPVTYKVVKEATTAVTGLRDGTYDFIDSLMGIQTQAEEINTSNWGKILCGYEWGYQEIGINHMHPIFGMNPKDPRAMYPGFRFPPDLKTRNSLYLFFSLLPIVILIPAIGFKYSKRLR